MHRYQTVGLGLFSLCVLGAAGCATVPLGRETSAGSVFGHPQFQRDEPSDEAEAFAATHTPAPAAPTPTPAAPATPAPAATPAAAAATAPTPALVPVGGTFAEGHAAGEVNAEAAPLGSWPIAGFTGGICLGAVGCLGVAGAGDMVEARPAFVDTTRSPEYLTGYQEGYSHRVRTRRANSALEMGAYGTAIAISIWAAIYEQQQLANNSYRIELFPRHW